MERQGQETVPQESRQPSMIHGLTSVQPSGGGGQLSGRQRESDEAAEELDGRAEERLEDDQAEKGAEDRIDEVLRDDAAEGGHWRMTYVQVPSVFLRQTGPPFEPLGQSQFGMAGATPQSFGMHAPKAEDDAARLDDATALLRAALEDEEVPGHFSLAGCRHFFFDSHQTYPFAVRQAWPFWMIGTDERIAADEMLLATEDAFDEAALDFDEEDKANGQVSSHTRRHFCFVAHQENPAAIMHP
jgi:hypothetical protein